MIDWIVKAALFSRTCDSFFLLHQRISLLGSTELLLFRKVALMSHIRVIQ